jgi:hypothetical protein
VDIWLPAGPTTHLHQLVTTDGPARREHAAMAATARAQLALLACLAGFGLSAVATANSEAHTVSAAAVSARHHGSARARRGHPRPGGARTLKMIWGPLTLPDGASAFPTYRQLGVQVLQIELIWARTAPTAPADPTNPADPAYHWPRALDEAVSEASQYGIQVAVMVRGTPPWANGGRDPSWAPEDPATYAAFLQAASHRYPTVHEWMIWGEITREGNFNPMPPNSPVGPQRYALLLNAAYGALKAVSPANMVIGGMTFTAGLLSTPDVVRWMRLPNGDPPPMDYWGHNPYSTRYPNLFLPPYGQVRDISDTDTLHSELAQAYRGHGPTPKLWLSEFGISSGKPNRAFNFYVSPAVQAKWVTAAFRLADSLPYVVGLGWYDLVDEPTSVQGNVTEGLLTDEGAPKPSFYAYAQAP